MKNIFTIFKKEFYRVMSDKRLIFTTILLPGLAIFVMYSAMGGAINNSSDDMDSHKIIVYTENMPNEFRLYINQEIPENPEFHDVADSDMDTVVALLKEGDIDLIILFDEDFMTVLEDYESLNYTLPNVDVYFNPGERYSENSIGVFYGYLNSFFHNEATNPDRYGSAYDIATFNTNNNGLPFVVQYENKGIGQGLSMLLPMLIIMFLFSGAMSIGPDSIAGEKERGTIATLLVTPVKRSEIAIGKVMSLSLISLMSAISSFIGIILSLPKLLGGQLPTDVPVYSIYSINDYLMLLSIIFVTVLVIVGLISVISAYAKTIKEASTLILPFYFLSIMIGISTMFSGEGNTDLYVYLIPIYSSVNMIISILSFEVIGIHYLLTIVSSLVYVSIFIYVLNRLFQSETIMFSK